MSTTLSALLRRTGGRWVAGSGAPGAAPTTRGGPAWPPPPVDPLGGDAARVRASTRLGDLWEDLGPAEQQAVLDPVGHLTHVGRQSDRTTCGSAVLVMLAAAGDPALALWLATGHVPPDRPPELTGATIAQLAALARTAPDHRFAALQRVVKHRTNRRALVGLPWPAALGTPPWGAARVARFAGLRFGHRPVDDGDPRHLAGVLDEVAAALDLGVPVPVYSGGDTSGGWAAAVPRHVVLVHARTADGFRVWEPATGRLLTLRPEDLRAPRGRREALGGWSRLVWVVLPQH